MGSLMGDNNFRVSRKAKEPFRRMGLKMVKRGLFRFLGGEK